MRPTTWSLRELTAGSRILARSPRSSGTRSLIWNRRRSSGLGHRGEAAFEVGDQIVLVLEPDVEAQGRAAGRPARRGAVAGAIEHDDEALVSAPGKPHAEQLERIEQSAHGGLAGRLEHDAEQPRGSGEIPPPDRVPGIVLERVMQHAPHFR